MFKWLLGKRQENPKRDRLSKHEEIVREMEAANPQFAKAYDKVLETADYLKTPCHRSLSDKIVKNRTDEFLAEFNAAKIKALYDAFSEMIRNDKDGLIDQNLSTVAVMFQSMADRVLPSDRLNVPTSLSFSEWANSFTPEGKHKLVRFAYIATTNDQQQSGGTARTTLAMRILLLALLANASDDASSRKLAAELFAYIDDIIFR